MSKRFKHGWNFKEWSPDPALPPEGEDWVWRIDFGVSRGIGNAIGRLKDEWVYLYGGGECSLAKHATPLFPFIDPTNPPTLESVPELERVEASGYESVLHRRGGMSFDEMNRSRGLAKSIHVLARPHAAEALGEGEWPEKYIDLPKGVYADVRGIPVGRMGFSPPDSEGERVHITNRHNTIPIDPTGKPRIIGTLIEPIFQD